MGHIVGTRKNGSTVHLCPHHCQPSFECHPTGLAHGQYKTYDRHIISAAAHPRCTVACPIYPFLTSNPAGYRPPPPSETAHPLTIVFIGDPNNRRLVPEDANDDCAWYTLDLPAAEAAQWLTDEYSGFIHKVTNEATPADKESVLIMEYVSYSCCTYGHPTLTLFLHSSMSSDAWTDQVDSTRLRGHTTTSSKLSDGVTSLGSQPSMGSLVLGGQATCGTSPIVAGATHSSTLLNLCYRSTAMGFKDDQDFSRIFRNLEFVAQHVACYPSPAELRRHGDKLLQVRILDQAAAAVDGGPRPATISYTPRVDLTKFIGHIEKRSRPILAPTSAASLLKTSITLDPCSTTVPLFSRSSNRRSQ